MRYGMVTFNEPRFARQKPKKENQAALSVTRNNDPLNTPGVTFVTLPDAQAVARKAADLIESQPRQKPDSTILWSTGNTPLPTYRELLNRLASRKTSVDLWERVYHGHLDEYCFKPGEIPKVSSFADDIQNALFSGLPGRGKALVGNYTSYPMSYEAWIREKGLGGADLAVLGIGTNGHIAFNEPGSSPDSRTRRVQLSDATMKANFGAENVGKPGYPTEAVTVGLATLMDARRIILIATGEKKRDIVRRAFDPTTPPDPQIPASWLKRHPNVTVLTDFPV